MDLEERIHRMPKVELHIHLEGAVSPETYMRLCERNRLTPAFPLDPAQPTYPLPRPGDFQHFVRLYLAIQDAIRTADDFALVVYELARDRAAQRVVYSEVTVTPYTHIWQDKGLSPEAIIEGLEEGRRRAREDFGVELRWILDIPRALPEPAATWTADWAIAWQERGVVALGLGGSEARGPAERFAAAFTRARAAGLHSVPHAGETGGPASIWAALHALGAERIGHGVRAIEDPLLLTYLKARQIPLEVNLTSNIALGLYPTLDHHPFPHLWRMGLYLTLNSDDPPLFRTTLTEEYVKAVRHFGLTWNDVCTLVLNAAQATFLPPAEKQRLVQTIQQELAALSEDQTNHVLQGRWEDEYR